MQAKEADPGEADAANAASAPDASHLEAFWGVVVEEGLFTSSHERKFLGFQLFQPFRLLLSNPSRQPHLKLKRSSMHAFCASRAPTPQCKTPSEVMPSTGYRSRSPPAKTTGCCPMLCSHRHHAHMHTSVIARMHANDAMQDSTDELLRQTRSLHLFTSYYHTIYYIYHGVCRGAISAFISCLHACKCRVCQCQAAEEAWCRVRCEGCFCAVHAPV
eukprot:308811-Pelagomonas_calceolata.AAC.4